MLLHQANEQQLDILYHDEYLVAVHKPAGLLVHRLDKPTLVCAA